MRRNVVWRAVGAVAVLLLAARVQADPARELGRLTAKAAVLMDNQTGEVHFARNPTLQLPPASTTKVLTAMIALRQGDPDDVLRVSTYATTMQPTKIYLRPGWSLRMRDLVYAILLRSANDASVVLAEGIGGSVPGFARMMNATAYAAGATQSNFVNPNGLPAAGHYSTARDLALIMRQALQAPGMREIMSTPTAVIQPYAGSRKRIGLRSTNRLLWRDDLHVIGKTGYTRQAKRCFVGAASANGREVIVAVLGSTDLWGDVELLVEYGLGQSRPGSESVPTGWQQAAGTAPTAEPPTGWRVPSASASVADQRAEPRLVAKAARVAPPAEGDSDRRERGLRYHLQVAEFRSRSRADRLRQDVARRGYNASVETVRSKAHATYRVTVRGLTSRDAARKAAQALRKALRVDPLIVASGA